MTYETADLISFVAQEPVRAFDTDFKAGDSVEVLLGQDWDDQDGAGDGGPWGFAGYTTEKIEEIAARAWEGGKGREVYCKSQN